MVWKGLERSVITYSSLISACEKGGRWEAALQLFDEMTRDGCSPNTVTYNSLIAACGQGAFSWGEALGAGGSSSFLGSLRTLEASHSHAPLSPPRPNQTQPNQTNHLSSPGGLWEKAQSVFDQMQSSGCAPDVVTYTSLISAYERGGQWHLALQAFQRMLAQGCRPDAIVYNAMVDALWQTGVVWAQVGGVVGGWVT
jgi:pentatricopeptide repeat domain-containing protein 1